MRAWAIVIILLLAATPLVSGNPPTPATEPVFGVYTAPNGLGDFSGEPSLGVNPHTGNVLYQAFSETLRVTFDDSVQPPAATWQDATPLSAAAITNNDPYLWVDKETGRTWAGGLVGHCSSFAITDDDGQSWMPAGNACASPAFDHEKLVSGPWRGAQPAQATYERALYYCAHTTVQQCAVSYDGGLTFSPAVPINPLFAFAPSCFGLFGNPRISDDGRVYVPPRFCFDRAGEDRAGVIVSETNGLTWLSPRLVPDSTRSDTGFNPSLSITPSGWLYLAWEGADGLPHVALSKSQGRFWMPSVPITAGSGLQTATFLATVTGDDDRVAVAYLATADAGDGFAEGFEGTWDLYVSMSVDQGVTWTTTKVTDDPVQRGWICAGGVSCTTGRNLLDFIDATTDATGRILVGFADGCIGACAGASGTASQSTESKAAIARQYDGPCLIAGGCGVAPGTPVPPAFDDQCNSNTVIFSSNSRGTPSLNSHALACIVSPANPGYDTAIINPGSDRVTIRYTQDPGVPTITARIDGLGLVDHEVTLTCSAGTVGVTCNSGHVAIDGTASGSITAIVLKDGVELDRVTFHTVV